LVISSNSPLVILVVVWIWVNEDYIVQIAFIHRSMYRDMDDEEKMEKWKEYALSVPLQHSGVWGCIGYFYV